MIDVVALIGLILRLDVYSFQA